MNPTNIVFEVTLLSLAKGPSEKPRLGRFTSPRGLKKLRIDF